MNLARIFSPRSVAVVGASARGHTARIVRDNIRTLGGDIPVHFVNPRYTEVEGQPCYPTLSDLPEPPDCVVIALGPARVPSAVEEAARLGASCVVIPGGGIVEGGEPARIMQAEVTRLARETGIAVVGPNCMGFIDLTTRVAAYIGDVNPWQPRGGVAGIAQSGSVTDAFVHAGTRIGWSRIVSCGAEVSLDVCDYLAYDLDDPETHAVVLFVEGFKRPERFLALADRALAIGKPIAVVKVGRSPQAQAAAVAHSGSLAGEDAATDAALAAAGVIRCADLDELLEVAELLAGCHRLGRTVGRGRTGIVTVSTGEASLIADLAPELGLSLPAVPDAARLRLLADLPTLGYIGNPIDPWGADEPSLAYGAAFEAFADSGAFDVLVAVHDSPYRDLIGEVETGTTVVAALLDATTGRPGILPVLVSLTSGEISHEIRRPLDAAGGVPYLRGLRESFGAIARLATWEARRATRLSEGPRRDAWPSLAADRTTIAVEASTAAVPPAPGPRTILAEREALELLGRAGLPVIGAVQATDPEAAVAAAAVLGGSVALKLDASGLAHKSDIGGVRLGLVGPDAVRAAAAELLALQVPAGATVRGVLVEPMAAPGIELIAGVVRDAQFGPVVLVGLGGVLAEVLRDTATELAPLSHDAALAMLGRLRGAAVLDGVRGGPAVDRTPVADLLVRLARFAIDRPDVVEIDLNPVIAGPAGCLAVDALIVLEGSVSG